MSEFILIVLNCVVAAMHLQLTLVPRNQLFVNLFPSSNTNINQLWFDDTAVLEAARNQGDIDENIGQDVSLSLTYRPKTSQNIVIRIAASALIPGKGYEDLYGSETPYSILANLILAY